MLAKSTTVGRRPFCRKECLALWDCCGVCRPWLGGDHRPTSSVRDQAAATRASVVSTCFGITSPVNQEAAASPAPRSAQGAV